MTTLIAVYNSRGLVGRCDAKCYDAEHPKCECICGGLNHGAGRQKARENTKELADKWIAQVEEKTGYKVASEVPARAPQQRGLFDDK